MKIHKNKPMPPPRSITAARFSTITPAELNRAVESAFSLFSRPNLGNTFGDRSHNTGT
jgi:hypothetical protein